MNVTMLCRVSLHVLSFFSDHMWTGLQAFSKLRLLDVSFNCIASLSELTPLAFLHDLISVSDSYPVRQTILRQIHYANLLFLLLVCLVVCKCLFQFHLPFISHFLNKMFSILVFILVKPSREPCCVLSFLSTCYSCLSVSHTKSWTSEFSQRKYS